MSNVDYDTNDLLRVQPVTTREYFYIRSFKTLKHYILELPIISRIRRLPNRFVNLLWISAVRYGLDAEAAKGAEEQKRVLLQHVREVHVPSACRVVYTGQR